MTKKIGITQRVEVINSYNERRDCLDQQWWALLEQAGYMAVPVPNHPERTKSWLESMELDGFILSGGNDLSHLPNPSNPATERDSTEITLLKYAQNKNIPVLAVCRGLQMLNHYLGGQLVPAHGHSATRHFVRSISEKHSWPGDLDAFEVNSFHNWTLSMDSVATELVPTMCAPDYTIEAVWHCELPWTGIMWHPERERPFRDNDLQLITQLFRGNS